MLSFQNTKQFKLLYKSLSLWSSKYKNNQYVYDKEMYLDYGYDDFSNVMNADVLVKQYGNQMKFIRTEPRIPRFIKPKLSTVVDMYENDYGELNIHDNEFICPQPRIPTFMESNLAKGVNRYEKKKCESKNETEFESVLNHNENISGEKPKPIDNRNETSNDELYINIVMEEMKYLEKVYYNWHSCNF